MRIGQEYVTEGGNLFVVTALTPSLITTETIGHDGEGKAAVRRRQGEILYVRPAIFQALLEKGYYKTITD